MTQKELNKSTQVASSENEVKFIIEKGMKYLSSREDVSLIIKSDYIREHYDEVWISNLDGHASRHIFNAGHDADFYEVICIYEQETGKFQFEPVSLDRTEPLIELYVEHIREHNCTDYLTLLQLAHEKFTAMSEEKQEDFVRELAQELDEHRYYKYSIDCVELDNLDDDSPIEEPYYEQLSMLLLMRAVVYGGEYIGKAVDDEIAMDNISVVEYVLAEYEEDDSEDDEA